MQIRYETAFTNSRKSMIQRGTPADAECSLCGKVETLGHCLGGCTHTLTSWSYSGPLNEVEDIYNVGVCEREAVLVCYFLMKLLCVGMAMLGACARALARRIVALSGG
jgi:hypothetical protein